MNKGKLIFQVLMAVGNELTKTIAGLYPDFVNRYDPIRLIAREACSNAGFQLVNTSNTVCDLTVNPPSVLREGYWIVQYAFNLEHSIEIYVFNFMVSNKVEMYLEGREESIDFSQNESISEADFMSWFEGTRKANGVA